MYLDLCSKFFLVSVRGYHRCKSSGLWDNPGRVIVQCKFNPLKKMEQMETMMEDIQLDVAELTEQSSDNCE